MKKKPKNKNLKHKSKINTNIFKLLISLQLNYN